MLLDNTSPYLKHPGRLADVIAAIQAMATYRYYKLDFSGWSDRISGNANFAEHWKQVFIEHPEFFRLDGTGKKASLVVRRQHRRRYDVGRFRELSQEEYDALDQSYLNSRISRIPLSPAELSGLISTAIDLHARALEQKQASRWWVPILIAIFSATASLIGAYIGAALSG